MSVDTLRQMPRAEKLKLMEALWEDLSREDEKFESPGWHAEELAATEKRLAEGNEKIIHWADAKRALRNKSE